MARTLNEVEHIQKRSEILDVAQRLVYTKGYEEMSIQDILDELKMSKGAFYHYYSSKQVLMEDLIERMQAEAKQVLMPIIMDENLTALEKLHRYFESATHWKLQYKDMLERLLRVWYNDNNAIVRQKAFNKSIKRMSPMLAMMVTQGIREGVFHTAYPQQVAEFLIIMLQGLGDTFADAIINRSIRSENGQREKDWQRIKITFEAYTEALERVLGAAPGSVKLIDVESLKEWLM